MFESKLGFHKSYKSAMHQKAVVFSQTLTSCAASPGPAAVAASAAASAARAAAAAEPATASAAPHASPVRKESQMKYSVHFRYLDTD